MGFLFFCIYVKFFWKVIKELSVGLFNAEGMKGKFFTLNPFELI